MKSLHPLHEECGVKRWRVFILFILFMKNMLWRDGESSSSSWRMWCEEMKRCEEMKSLHAVHEETSWIWLVICQPMKLIDQWNCSIVIREGIKGRSFEVIFDFVLALNVFFMKSLISSWRGVKRWRVFILFMKRCEEMKNLHPLHPLHEEVWRDEESSSSSWRGVMRWRIFILFILFMKMCEEMKKEKSLWFLTL